MKLAATPAPPTIALPPMMRSSPSLKCVMTPRSNHENMSPSPSTTSPSVATPRPAIASSFARLVNPAPNACPIEEYLPPRLLKAELIGHGAHTVGGNGGRSHARAASSCNGLRGPARGADRRHPPVAVMRQPKQAGQVVRRLQAG